MEKSIYLPISSISSNFFRKKLEEIAIFQFPPGVPEEIDFFRKKNYSEANWRHMVTEIWVNIGPGNGLLPNGTKPLPEPMLTYHH